MIADLPGLAAAIWVVAILGLSQDAPCRAAG